MLLLGSFCKQMLNALCNLNLLSKPSGGIAWKPRTQSSWKQQQGTLLLPGSSSCVITFLSLRRSQSASCCRAQIWRAVEIDNWVSGTGGGRHRQEAADAELLEAAEGGRGARAARVQQLRHLMAQLERGALEAHVAAGRDLQDEPEVDVHQVPPPVQQDVAVVPVLGLQQEARQRIPASPAPLRHQTPELTPDSRHNQYKLDSGCTALTNRLYA